MPLSSRGRSVEANATPPATLGVVGAALPDRVAREVQAVAVQPRERERSFDLAEPSLPREQLQLVRADRGAGDAARVPVADEARVRRASSCRRGPSARAKRATRHRIDVGADDSADLRPLAACGLGGLRGEVSRPRRHRRPTRRRANQSTVASPRALGLAAEHAPEHAHEHARPRRRQLETVRAEPLRLRRARPRTTSRRNRRSASWNSPRKRFASPGRSPASTTFGSSTPANQRGSSAIVCGQPAPVPVGVVNHDDRRRRPLAQERDQRLVDVRRVAAVRQHRALALGVEAVDEQHVRDRVVVADDEVLEAVRIDAGCERRRARPPRTPSARAGRPAARGRRPSGRAGARRPTGRG